MRRSAKNLIWLTLWAFLFSLFCLIGYFKRGDDYHKQSDQFYYLSIADSLRAGHGMRVQVSPEMNLPITATSGAALVMLPFSKMSARTVFLCVSVFYLILNVSSVFPLMKVLTFFGLDESAVFLTLLIYFLSFSVTMFKLWPVNEGPALALVSWFLYFILVSETKWPALILAFLAPIFRIYIVLVEGAVLLTALLKRDRSWLAWAWGSLVCSGAGMLLYFLLFPYHQQPLAAEVAQATSPLLYALSHILQANAHLILPETVTKVLFGTYDFLISAVLGIIWLVLVTAGLLGLWRRKEKNLFLFSVMMITITTVTLGFSVTIVARFLTPAYLWMIAAIVPFLKDFRSRWVQVFTGGLIILNILLAVSFFMTKSTDPEFNYLEEAKDLATHAQQSSVVFCDTDFPVNNRQIYAYYRRPETSVTEIKFQEKAVVLSLHPRTLSFPKDCTTQEFIEGDMSLINFDCSHQGVGPSRNEGGHGTGP